MKNWVIWLIFGIISVLGGIFAIANPIAATLAAEQIAGVLFLIAGIVWLFSTFRADGWKAKLWSLLAGLAITWLGVSLLAHPLAGIISLTFVVAISFLVGGVFKIMMAIPARGTQFFWPLLISGGASVVLAMIIFGNFPKSIATTLGFLLGLQLIFDGVTMVTVSLWGKETDVTEANSVDG